MHTSIARRRSVLFGLTAIACFSLGAAAADAGRVEGTLDVAGKMVHLDHVLVVSMGNEEGLEDSPRLRIFLSDAEIPLRYASAATTAATKTWARGAKATAVVVMADPSGRNSGGVANLLGMPGMTEAFRSTSNSDGLVPFKVAGGRASGAIAFEGQQGVLKARFDAPVTVVPSTQDLKEGAAIASAPVQALLAYRAALKKGDLKEAARHATLARMQQIEAFRAQAPPDVYKSMLREVPEGKELLASVRRVVVRGDVASIILSTREIEEMALEAGAWKVD